MRSTDGSLVFSLQGMAKILFFLLIMCDKHFTHGLFKPGMEYTYLYDAISNTGVLLPSSASSSWGFHGKLIIQTEHNSTIMQLQSLKKYIWNGKDEERKGTLDITANEKELLKPFQITYKMGLIDNLSVETESTWVTNIKRSIAGILQLDLANLEKQVAFHSTEVNHYGQCNIEYVVNSESNNEKLIRKFLDPRTCTGHPHRTWTNIPKMQCPNNDQNPIVKSSERIYKVNLPEHEILFINASGGIYVQPFQSFGEAQFHFTRQSFKLISVVERTNKIFINDFHNVVLQHELPEIDLTQGRATPDKETVFKTIGKLLDRLSHRLESPGLDTETSTLHNTTISVLLYYLDMLNRNDLQIAYNKISGTSYKEETIRNMFLEALPQVGNKEVALFILDLILDKKVSDISAIQLLTQLPFHIRKPDVQLLVSLQSFLSLPRKISPEIQNTAILSYGTLIYKTCLLYCPYEMLDDYVRLYLDRFTESTEYEKKMIWLEGLANIQLGRVVEFLEPIASGNNAESRHFRVLAAWASLPTAPLRPDVIYPVYWPILVNRTEHLEMRVAALTLLIISSPTPNRLISLYWYMQTEPNEHLYNYFYTTLKSMEHTTHPCYVHLGGIAAQFTRVVRRPQHNPYLVTGNYLFDYQDTYRKFGAMIHGIVVANPLTNIPEVMYVTLNNYGSGININHVSLYIKAEGLLQSLSTYLENPTQIKDILKQFKLDQRQNAPVHLEIIARVQQKAILCLHLNETSIIKGLKYLSSLPDNMYHMYQNMEFHVNQQRINVPLTMESVQVTDLGTNVRLAVMATSLISIRGNFTHTTQGRNNHVILRTSIHGTETIENYNPLSDLWHGAERAQSVHGYLPINVTIGLEERPFISYNTPGEHLKAGITAHARTATSVRGVKVQSKLKHICPTCPALYTVTKSPTYEPKTVNLFDIEFPELGGQAHVKIFDCESAISQENLIKEIWSSHRANYQIWPLIQFPLIGVHLLDYFTYVPPKGSCGLAAYVNSYNMQHSQIKLEYAKLGKYHILSLTHYELESSHILHQWNLAVLYEATSWISDSLKMKATRYVPGEKVLKFCLEAEREMPWEWDFLSNKPSDPAEIKVNIIWGLSDSAKGKCNGPSISLNLLGEISKKQIEENHQVKWPYDKCREESKGKNFIPYTDSCYEASRELSTLRKYKIFLHYENLPEYLSKLAWKFRAFYDLVGGNSSNNIKTNEFAVTAIFPKESNAGELYLNNDKVDIKYNPDFIDFFLTRTRIHKYMDVSFVRMFFSTCVITPNFIRSVHNTTYLFYKNHELLLLGQCYDENPSFALTAKNTQNGVNVNLSDESGTIRIVSYKEGGAVYNTTTYIPIARNYVFHTIDSKKIRLDDKSVDVLLSNIVLFMHWTQEQILLFYPNYISEFSCGMCTIHNSHDNNLYEKL